ncbi:MAG: hypothetical protein ACE5KG_00140 [Nitrososphaerales archaeon]
MFAVKNEEGTINCAAYQPTGPFKLKCSALEIGDIVEIGGGIRKANARYPRVLNLEFLRALYLEPKYQWLNPKCSCGRTMESAGRAQGFRCRKCGYKDRAGRKVSKEVQRELSMGLYQPPPRSQRHLTKPLARIGREKIWKREIPKPGWYSFTDSSIS